MKTGWTTKKLSELCGIELGKTPSRANSLYWDEKHKTKNVWLSIADLLNTENNIVFDSKEYLSAQGAGISKIVLKGTLLLSFKLTLGRVAFAGCDLYTNEAIAALSIKNESEISKHYLFYFLQFFDWKAAAAGDVKIKGITFNKEKLKEIEIFFPPLPEQQRIVRILDETFAGIAVARANAEKNLQNAREVFESYLNEVFNRHAEGWLEMTLEEVCKLITDGKHGDCVNEEGSGYFFLSAKDVKDGTLNFENARQIRKVDFEETHRRTNLEPGDILMTNAGTIGRMAVAPIDDRTRRTTFQKSVAVLKLRNNVIDNKFAYYCLTSGLSTFIRLSAGTAQKNLLLRDLRRYSFTMPQSVYEQKDVAIKIGNLSEKIHKLDSIFQRKINALEELKQSLLHQAFTGQL